ncbi:MAG: phenylalanine--tRNA ligase subunit alpha [Bombilactobacillus mellis]|uniref:phenylalanine--tRNA ligase subunit alpha n=1 Tax=Bombilactobacillus mellis TaxID=1218508 RepID=UPI001581191F|nr:phenylalanine--tRNA ligase subunit alpha [Bombilactobacillus mellis]MCT6841133.1 phenylalanine--tRNA ligase subunit alpha [Bombilactobacillus mellis]MCT6857295.1 phenylalanine--tRNA ligase subunit alpha [Bombilactobacillus mellis]MCT6872441.1 phenylalanine--tRNA ligase subunit alpha [Bombilactobacillus mellis]MCX0279312.1 phenylalanine--tRNA ligase subunit alpha [Bombilactobacillus mellis]NUF97905.1 phenylalanine--tRNA ligase subunit alpha [Bombilactobacillus mellis]
MELQKVLDELHQQGLQQIAAADSLTTLNEIRIKFLGKKGSLTQALRQMGSLSEQERPQIGALANNVRNDLQQALDQAKQDLENKAVQQQLQAEKIDVTLPGKPRHMGTKHVINQVMDDIEELFIGLGYEVVNGPEVEEDHYNFEMMNLPKDHPARDMQDTFYITSEILMRTQTSPVQARTMEKHDFSKGPLKMISPGKVYRRDTDDLTHSHQFNQIEGLVIDKHITMGDLKGTLELTARHIFGQEREIRLRPSYFPFTEPSVEVDVSCFACGGKGCAVCKHTGWVEVLGAGMVHPNVLTNAGVDPKVYGGFAFGLGPDRFAMLKYGINDIRDFYLNDVRFLEQFQGE